MSVDAHGPTIAAPAENLAAIHRAIAAARARAGRAGAVSVVAVSKQQPLERVRAALEAGHRAFGENRVQEAAGKWPALREAYAGVELHLVGPLQSNKAADAVAAFDVIQTVDRDRIAASLAAEMERQNRRPRLFVQVNTGEEPQKAGVPPAAAMEFIDRCRGAHGLVIDGLMCIPPADEPPAPHFALLAKLAQEAGVGGLSMGMSGDFEIAVELGATHVRIGEGVFGPRQR